MAVGVAGYLGGISAEAVEGGGTAVDCLVVVELVVWWYDIGRMGHTYVV